MGSVPPIFFQKKFAYLKKIIYFFIIHKAGVLHILARKPRKYTNTGIYHIILRGNDHQNIFCDEKDRNFFLGRIKKYSAELDIDIYAYCLMSNHVHILLGRATDFLSKFVQKLANSYVYYFNHRYERSGHLFQGRFKSEPIESDDYFKTVLRYILQNSEGAGLGKMETYKWNSYRELNQRTALERCIIRSDFIIRTFSGIGNVLDFLALKEQSKCIEYENRSVCNDECGIALIKKMFHVKSTFYLKQIPIEELKIKLHDLKKFGLSCNQIRRLTGISKEIIRFA